MSKAHKFKSLFSPSSSQKSVEKKKINQNQHRTHHINKEDKQVTQIYIEKINELLKKDPSNAKKAAQIIQNMLEKSSTEKSK